ncbi:hypothetical protein TraAM80_07175 [Trypanosoma rangeli]|uniref:Uncharacterized protein n=1 Tax=Trypanosoma rangeli TaxID=5698 RepID=A0A422N6W0_TRYRA|nr:uncharacterized protein TraAM80_07175 [Trypanosoma rangeli]RNF01176.1 hypothetical protein TraAM80_07175 [Trypanosoma rangeli]|eukprot:RNF01176.1 hypothetical protein TraAM80_07175 [Trypanosoma rangeli]
MFSFSHPWDQRHDISFRVIKKPGFRSDTQAKVSTPPQLNLRFPFGPFHHIEAHQQSPVKRPVAFLIAQHIPSLSLLHCSCSRCFAYKSPKVTHFVPTRRSIANDSCDTRSS